MASHSLIITSVRFANGRAYIRWSDNSEDEFDSKADVTEFVRSAFEDKAAANKFLKAIGLARYLRVDPQMNNPALIEGRTITITNESNTFGTIS